MRSRRCLFIGLPGEGDGLHQKLMVVMTEKGLESDQIERTSGYSRLEWHGPMSCPRPQPQPSKVACASGGPGWNRSQQERVFCSDVGRGRKVALRIARRN